MGIFINIKNNLYNLYNSFKINLNKYIGDWGQLKKMLQNNENNDSKDAFNDINNNNKKNNNDKE